MFLVKMKHTSKSGFCPIVVAADAELQAHLNRNNLNDIWGGVTKEDICCKHYQDMELMKTKG